MIRVSSKFFEKSKLTWLSDENITFKRSVFEWLRGLPEESVDTEDEDVSLAKNKLHQKVDTLNSFPSWMRSWLLSKVVGHNVKFVGTAGVEILEMSPERVAVRLQNHSRVQNHIGGIHAK